MAIMINVVNDDCGPKPIRVKIPIFFYGNTGNFTYENIFPTSNDIIFSC